MSHYLCRSFARRALAPIGAAATISTTTILLGENSSHRASLWCAERTASNTRRLILQRCRFSSESTPKEPVKKAVAEITSRQASTATATAASPSKSFLQWYEGHLQARPVQTKMVTGSLLWGIGDTVAQVVPVVAGQASSNTFQYDWARTGRAAFFGFAIHAPCSHLHFNFLEWLTVRAQVTGLGIPIFKAFMEQFVYWSWFSNSLYHGAMGAMQGQTPTQIYHRIADVLWETQKAQW
eukprot:CAMPEP_0116869474 /NCGR_PEP_ID=MMETSP0418-20121206/27781_1 /TAXON_ID=1158023 /ORGANISM="Astrosyne radiata, Strain 13vi08-1A" /LENGTH=237 /DNA_ID=CAMNT_0004505577 /DNA_START=29 /DNA_END=739 /DNA_ORIENTATION=-